MQSILCDIARDFLCARWHRQRQAETPYRSVPTRRRSASRLEQNTQRPPARRELIGQMYLVEDQPTTSIQPGTNSVTSPSQGRFITVAMIRGNQVPWQITDWSPIVLSVANDAAGQQILEIRSFEESPSSQNDDDDLECCVCHGEDNDEPVMLQCRSCSFHVLLDCMEKWLELRRSGQHPSCPQW